MAVSTRPVIVGSRRGPRLAVSSQFFREEVTPYGPDHRSFGAAAFVCLLVLGGPVASASDNLTKHHALSLIGTPKHGPDFTHFDWVNPNAPKGGRVRQWAMGTFDSLNPFPVKGSAAAGLSLIYDTLMTSQPRRGRRELRPARRMGDLSATTSPPPPSSCARRPASTTASRSPPEDVIFSLEAIKKASPNFAFYYKNVTKAEKTGDRQVTFTVRRQGQPRAAGDRRRAADPAQALLGGHRGQRRAARSRQVDARDSAGLRPLPHQGGGCRPHHHLRARQGLVGQGPARHQGPVELRRDPLRLLPRPRARPSRPSSPASSTTGASSAPSPGPRGYDFDAVKRGLRQDGQAADRQRRAACSRSPSTSAGRSSRTRACARPSTWPSTSSGPTRTCSTTSTRASAATSTTRS